MVPTRPTQTYSFPLTVAAASGERLVVVGGISARMATIPPAASTDRAQGWHGIEGRRQVPAHAVPDLSARMGTASTSINVVATVAGSAKPRPAVIARASD
jgi:hypothetical protein